MTKPATLGTCCANAGTEKKKRFRDSLQERYVTEESEYDTLKLDLLWTKQASSQKEHKKVCKSPFSLRFHVPSVQKGFKKCTEILQIQLPSVKRVNSEKQLQLQSQDLI